MKTLEDINIVNDDGQSTKNDIDAKLDDGPGGELSEEKGEVLRQSRGAFVLGRNFG